MTRNRPIMYVLADDRRTPVPVYDQDLPSVSEKLAKQRRNFGYWYRVAQTETRKHWVSTVFLGIDHNYDPTQQLPVLWETMVFPVSRDKQRSYSEVYMQRYTTRLDAERGHERAVAWAREQEPIVAEGRIGKRRVVARMVRGRWKIAQR